MKRVIYVFLLVLIFTFNVDAHPGRTDSDGCHTCRTNCENWGLSYGEYHCHNSGSSSSSGDSGSYSKKKKKNHTAKKKKVRKKSSNVKISSITINDQEIDLDDQLTYETRSKTIDVNVILDDDKAKKSISKPKELKIGENKIVISVKAENGTSKKYTLLVTRLKELSSNKNITIKLNGQPIAFSNQESDKIIVPRDVDKLDISYDLEDKNSTVLIMNNEYLKSGENKVQVKVTAEDNSSDIYTININKENNSSFVLIFFTQIIVGILVLVSTYFFIKKVNIIALVICSIFFPLAGIALLWKTNQNYSHNRKIMLTMILSIWFGIIALMSI